MDNVVTLNADNTHLFPGAKLTVNESMPTQDSTREVLILFSDYSQAEGTLKPEHGRFRLQVEEHSTAAGTKVGRKAWNVEAADDRVLNVKSKLLWLPSAGRARD